MMDKGQCWLDMGQLSFLLGVDVKLTYFIPLILFSSSLASGDFSRTVGRSTIKRWRRSPEISLGEIRMKTYRLVKEGDVTQAGLLPTYNPGRFRIESSLREPHLDRAKRRRKEIATASGNNPRVRGFDIGRLPTLSEPDACAKP
jgi:hypothetical protein